MRIIVSPAKKMRLDRDSFPVRDLPVFLQDAERICAILQEMTESDLKKLWNAMIPLLL